MTVLREYVCLHMCVCVRVFVFMCKHMYVSAQLLQAKSAYYEYYVVVLFSGGEWIAQNEEFESARILTALSIALGPHAPQGTRLCRCQYTTCSLRILNDFMDYLLTQLPLCFLSGTSLHNQSYLVSLNGTEMP